MRATGTYLHHLDQRIGHEVGIISVHVGFLDVRQRVWELLSRTVGECEHEM